MKEKIKKIYWIMLYVVCIVSELGLFALPCCTINSGRSEHAQKTPTCEDVKKYVACLLSSVLIPSAPGCPFPPRKCKYCDKFAFDLKEVAYVRRIEKLHCGGEKILQDNDAKSLLQKTATAHAKHVLDEPKRYFSYSSSDFYAMQICMAQLRKQLQEKYGVTLEEAGVTEAVRGELIKKYQAPLEREYTETLKFFPTDPEDNAVLPNFLVKMILEANPEADEKELRKYASRAYARMAERELRDLREWQYEYPNTFKHIDALRAYLTEGNLKPADIGTSEKELTLLTREFPSIKK